MNKNEREQKQRELIEEIGRYFDKEGFQPIAGRILGLLMVMDKEQFAFDEIAEELKISKSSASNVLKNLEIRGNIEYVTLPGDRKRYFRLKRYEGFKLIEEFKQKMEDTQKLFSYIIDLKTDKNSPNVQFLKEMGEMIGFLMEQIEMAKARHTNGKRP